MDATSTVDSLLRATQAYCVQLCEKETLRFGIAYYCPRFPNAAALNQFREVIVEKDEDAPQAVEEAERFFAEKNIGLKRWAPATGSSSNAVERLLEDRGFERRESHALSLTEWPEPDASELVRVLPARAMRAAFRAVVGSDLDRTGAPNRVERLEIAEERLNDPHYDAFVAMVDKKPAAALALYQVGDFARVMDLRLAAPAEGNASSALGADAGDALLNHVLALAKRLTMRRVLVQVPVEDEATISLFERFGFKTDGMIAEFERAGD